MKAFFMEHPEYKIIHSHIDAMSYFPLQDAKNSGVPVRIAHSHSSKFDRDIKLPIKFIAQKNKQKWQQLIVRVEKLLEDLCSMNDLLKSLEMQLILKNSSTTLLLEKEKEKSWELNLITQLKTSIRNI